MVENSDQMGSYMYEQLQRLYEHPIVGDIRGGNGLLCAVEFVKDRDSRERFPKEAELAKKLTPLLQAHGLLGRAGDEIYLTPPLCITKDEVDHLVHEVNDVVGELSAKL